MFTCAYTYPIPRNTLFLPRMSVWGKAFITLHYCCEVGKVQTTCSLESEFILSSTMGSKYTPHIRSCCKRTGPPSKIPCSPVLREKKLHTRRTQSLSTARLQTPKNIILPPQMNNRACPPLPLLQTIHAEAAGTNRCGVGRSL